jgi:hypothetical protein
MPKLKLFQQKHTTDGGVKMFRREDNVTAQLVPVEATSAAPTSVSVEELPLRLVFIQVR